MEQYCPECGQKYMTACGLTYMGSKNCCGVCGAELANFCGDCGVKLRPEPGKRICPFCDAVLKPGDRRCPVCGETAASALIKRDGKW